jgi:hypothetical protein
MKTSEFIKKLKSYGWFEYYTEENEEKFIAKIKERLAEYEIENEEVENFDALFPCTWLDPECIHGFGAYDDLLNELAADSFGLFNPVDTDEEWDDEAGTIELSYTLNGHKISHKWENTGSDYIDIEFWACIDMGIEKAIPHIALVDIEDSSGMYSKVFGSRKAIKEIAKCGLVSFITEHNI